MNILIDGLPFFLNKWDLGEFSKEFLSLLSTIKYLNIHLIRDKEIQTPLPIDLLDNISICNLKINRIADSYSPVINYMKKSNIDLYHCLNNGFSCYNGNSIKNVVTFHSIIPLDIEDYYSDNYKNKFYRTLPNILQHANKIICLSNTLKNDLIDLCGIDEDRVHVIYPTIGDIFKPLNKYMSNIYLKSKFNINSKFILYTGDFHKRKRLEELLEIFLRLIHLDDKLELIFLSYVNNLNLEYFNEINQLVRLMGLTHKVKFITSFTYDDKVHFFNSAQCYIDLSLYDGINISMLQALKCKCPIICSDIPINRELLSNNGIFVDLEDFTSIDDMEEFIINLDNMYVFDDDDYIRLMDNYNPNNAINSLLNLYKSIFL